MTGPASFLLQFPHRRRRYHQHSTGKTRVGEAAEASEWNKKNQAEFPLFSHTGSGSRNPIQRVALQTGTWGGWEMETLRVFQSIESRPAEWLTHMRMQRERRLASACPRIRLASVLRPLGFVSPPSSPGLFGISGFCLGCSVGHPWNLPRAMSSLPLNPDLGQDWWTNWASQGHDQRRVVVEELGRDFLPHNRHRRSHESNVGRLGDGWFAVLVSVVVQAGGRERCSGFRFRRSCLIAIGKWAGASE